MPAWGSPFAPSVGTVSPAQAGVLGADQGLVANTDTLVLTTASLAVGTWRVALSAEVVNGAAAVADALINIALGTATATFSGPIAADGTIPGVIGQAVGLSLECLAVVTVAGTLQLRATSTQTSTVKQNATARGALAVTGYVAQRIA